MPWVAFLAGYVLSVPYNVLVLVGVWRSAGRYEGEPRNADLARLATAGLVLLLTLT
jgi:heme/copper-type cytochrome/quinol oxidase subunit 1